MEIRNTAQLKAAILQLEETSELKKEALIEQFHDLDGMLKPGNLIKTLFSRIGGFQLLTDNVVNASMGMAAGMLSNKLVAGRSKNIFTKLLGKLVQATVSTIVTNNAPQIKQRSAELIRKNF